MPQSLLDQLKVGGRMFAFVGDAPVMEARLITRVSEDQYQTEDVFETVVPMLKNVQRKDEFRF